MDKLSFKVLRYISKQDTSVSKKALVEQFGAGARKSLVSLEADGFIKSGRTPMGIGIDKRPVLASNGIFEMTSKGFAYLEERPGKSFDRWLTRILAIWGALTGTVAMLIEIWQYLQK